MTKLSKKGSYDFEIIILCCPLCNVVAEKISHEEEEQPHRKSPTVHRIKINYFSANAKCQSSRRKISQLFCFSKRWSQLTITEQHSRTYFDIVVFQFFTLMMKNVMYTFDVQQMLAMGTNSHFLVVPIICNETSLEDRKEHS